MIISKTPLRISFVGGGSDLPAYIQHKQGAVLSTSIDKFVYVSINKKIKKGIRLAYSEIEEVTKIENIKHNVIKQTLKYFSRLNNIEITSTADIPSKGSGLGSSSAFTNGLINSIIHYNKNKISKKKLAEISSFIEIKKCKEHIGYQDQYATAYGGFNFIEFSKSKVTVKPIKCSKKIINKLENNIIIFNTNIARRASTILKKQQQNIYKHPELKNSIDKMVNIAYQLKKALELNNLSDFGKILNENWELKKSLSKNISNEIIDHYYYKALQNGAYGGKLLGAGNGGFLLFYAKKENHKKLIRALKDLQHVNIKFENEGSKIIYDDT